MKDLKLEGPVTCVLCDPTAPNKAVTKCNLKSENFTGCGRLFCADHGHPPFYYHSDQKLGKR